MDATNTIQTKHYRCGPYRFTATLPKIGLATDTERWQAATNGEAVPGHFDTLEEAMQAALDHQKAKAPSA